MSHNLKATVVIRSKDEADRLRLTLASLAGQSEAPEVVVVNDGSSDHTSAVLAETAGDLELVCVEHKTPRGRSVASNAGAEAASGDILIFLDGDTLAHPDFVERHLNCHRARPDIVARGETYHLRGTRFFADPETGSAMPGAEDRVARMSESEMMRSKITRRIIQDDFNAIDARARPGIYPGAGPQLLFDMEMDALRHAPDCDVLWIAASGSNQSLSARAFKEAGGFHPDMSINEHRELALRLTQAGLKMVCAEGARSYHMTHRSGWRDPLEETSWEKAFYEAHPLPEIPLLSVLWASFAENLPFPQDARILTLPQLETVASRYADIRGVDAVRQAHFNAAGSAQRAAS